MVYRPRVADRELTERLSAAGAVLIEGPKFCGKTETAKHQAASSVYLDTDTNARAVLALDPAIVLDGPTPRLIDEWQVQPSVWNDVRRVVDARGQPGQFILTGSAVPDDDITRHTGAGRFSRLRLRPMSLFESGHSNGTVSLADLLLGGHPRAAEPDLTIHALIDRIVVGGWPALQDRAVRDAQRSNIDYVTHVCRVDVERVDGIRRDPDKVGRLVTALSRSVSSEVSVKTLAADVGGADGPVSRNTIDSYLDALRRLMILEEQPAWTPHLRSRTTLRSAPKRHLVDPSLAAAALRAGPQQLLGDLSLLGLMFESLVVRDLRVYAQPLDATVSHYRDSSGLEVDAIVEAGGGTWGAFEVKLSPDSIESGATSLLRFAAKVDSTKTGPPGCLAVLTGSGFGYQRADGVSVVPIGALGP